MNLPELFPTPFPLPAAASASRMFIDGVGTAVPAHHYPQAACYEALRQTEVYRGLDSRSQALMRKLLAGGNGIRSRHLALDQITEIDQFNPDALQRRFEQHAPALGAQAGLRALTNAAVDVQAIDAILVSTCTGYLCPGLSSYLIERLGLRSDVIALDLVGNGCGAALPNLRMAQALLSGGDCARVLSVCVEVCSAAFYLDDDPGVLVSACLFGDGAAALVLGPKPPVNGGRRIEWIGFGAETAPAHRELLRFEHRRGMLRNILTPPVPRLAAQYAETVLDRVLMEQGLPRKDIQTWIWHAGGRDVLSALRERLGLDDDATRWSAEVLSEYGNMSSPSVLFALDRALTGGAAPGAWWLSSFGAGFSCYGALLKVN